MDLDPDSMKGGGKLHLSLATTAAAKPTASRVKATLTRLKPKAAATRPKVAGTKPRTIIRRAAEPTKYNTIYDFLIAAHAPLSTLLRNPNAYLLYKEIAKYLVCFSMADLCHDFRDLNVNIKLDGKAGTMSIGEHMLNKACAVFYKLNVADMTTLINDCKEIFEDKMGSDGKAKKYVAKSMTEFFIKLKTNYSAFFNPNSYDQLFEATAKFVDRDYTSNGDKDAIIAELGGVDNIALLIDSQNGNPTYQLFNRDPHKHKVSYYTNFATVLDPATKPSIGVEQYFKVFVQANAAAGGLPIDIKKEIAVYDAKHRLSNLTYTDRWNITSRFSDYGAGQPPIEETFNSANKPSVNNQGVFKSRGVLADEDVNPQININKNIHRIGIDHHTKSCGDRYEGLTFSDINDINEKIKYLEYNKLNGFGVAPKNAVLTPIDTRKNRVIFTLDLLFVRQLYSMIVNTVYCGVNKLTYYQFKEPKPLKRKDVINGIIAKRETIAYKINMLTTYNIDYTKINQMLLTLFDAISNKNAYDFCQNVLVLKYFIDNAATAAPAFATGLGRLITESNFKQNKFIWENADNLYNYLRQNTRDSIMDRSEFLNKFGEELSNALKLFDYSLQGDATAATNSLIKNYLKTVGILAEDIKTALSCFHVSEYTDILVHLIIMKHNKKYLNNRFYKEDRLYKYFTTTAERITPIIKEYQGIREHYFVPAQYNKVDILFGIVLEKILAEIKDNFSPGANYCVAIDIELDRYSQLFDNLLASIPAGSFTDEEKKLCKLVYAQLNAWFTTALILKVISICYQNNTLNNLYDDVLRKNGFEPVLREAPIALNNEVIMRPKKKEESDDIQKAKAAEIKDKRAFSDLNLAPIEALSTPLNALPMPAAGASSGLFTNLKYIIRYTKENIFGFVQRITELLTLDRAIAGGGSRSRSRTSKSTASLDELLAQKVQLMDTQIFDAPFHGISYVRSSDAGFDLIVKYEKLTKAKKAPVLVSRLKGGRMNTRRNQSIKLSQKRSSTRSSSREKSQETLLFAQGSQMPPINLSKSGSRSRSRGKSRSRIVSHDEGLDYLKRQMLAFIVLGFDITDEEVSVCKKYLPELASIHMARVHHHLFWLPFIEACNIEWPTLKAIYEQSIATLKSEYDESVPLSMGAISRQAEAISRTENNSIVLKSNQSRDLAELDREIATLKSQRKSASKSRASQRRESRGPTKSRQSILKNLSRDVALGYSEIEA